MKRAARLLMLARELRGEADRWLGTRPDVAEQLKRASHQMLRASSSGYTTDPQRVEELDALQEAAITMLVRHMFHRFERQLAEGVTP